MKKILLLIFIGLIASTLIFYKFPNLPKHLAFDEVEFSRLALSLKNKHYIPYSPLATGHSTLYFYIILFSFNIFGITNFALRFPSAVFGVLSVLIFYLIMENVFQQLSNRTMKQYLPFIFSLILLSSRWFFNFARFSFEVTFLLFLELTSIYFFLKANAKKSSIYLIASGIFTGLAFLSYTPGRIFFLLPLSFLVFQLVNPLTRKQFNKLIIKQLLYFLIPFLIIITPLTLYLFNHVDTRVNQELFLMNHEMPVSQKITGLWSNISSISLMFDIKGDMNGRHNYPGKPALNPILGILFIAGLVITVKNWKNPINLFSLFYFLLSILPALMTYPWENPNMLRTYTVLPSVVFFIGSAIYNLDKVLSKLLFNKNKLVIYFLLFVILLSSFYELRTYFKYQTMVFGGAFNVKESLPKAIKL